jgi:hypothetical protein
MLTNRWADTQTYTTKVIIAFPNFANTRKKLL